MPSYSSNALSVLNGIRTRLKTVQTVTISNIVRTAASSVYGSNTFRIHNEGKAVNGSSIGEYKEGRYKILRGSKGFETGFVNLEFTHKLKGDFNIAPVGDSIGVGFLTDYGSNLRLVLEKKYGKQIWGTTADDRNNIKEHAVSEIKKTLNVK